MPPSLPEPKREGVHIRSLSKGQDRVLSLLSMDGWGDALAATEFDQMEWAETLVTLIRSPDEKVKLAALREFRQTTLDLAKINGLITNVHAESTTQEEDRKVRKVMSQQRLVQSLNEDRLRLEQSKNGEGPRVVVPLPLEDQQSTELAPDFEGPEPVPGT